MHHNGQGMVRSALCFALYTLASLSLSGCSFLIQSIADPVAQHRVKQLKLPAAKVRGFDECLQSAGGLCRKPPSLDQILVRSTGSAKLRALATTSTRPLPEMFEENKLELPGLLNSEDRKRVSIRLKTGARPAERARNVLNSPVQTQLNQLFNLARGSVVRKADAGKSEPDVTFSMQQVKEYLELIDEVTADDGWAALEFEGRLLGLGTEEDRARHAYIAAYFAAYFRNGKFYEVTLDAAQLKAKAIAKLKDSIPGAPDSTYEVLFTKLFGELKLQNGKRTFGKINTQGFVSRGGQEIKFPGIEAELSLSTGKVDVTKLDYVVVGGDLVRLLLHAIYDAHDRLPGASNATAYGVPKFPPDANDPAKTDVDADEMDQIESRSLRVETVVGAGTGRWVRGLGFVALNNEALAVAIETAVGVAARKYAEKVMWCWTACGFNAATPALPEEIVLNVGLTGEPASDIGKVRMSN